MRNAQTLRQGRKMIVKTVIGHFADMLCMGAADMKHDISIEELREVVAPIAEKHGVESIYLFGSRARGDNDEDSDFDFYIVPGRIQTLTKLCGLLIDLEEALGKGVDIVSEDPHMREELLQEVLRDRKLVYES